MEVVVFQVAIWFVVWLINEPSSMALAAGFRIKPECQQQWCGNVEIPYPFGIGPKCYHNEWFAITCNRSSNGSARAYLQAFNNMEVGIISLEEQTITVQSTTPVVSTCSDKYSSTNKSETSNDLSGSPFLFSKKDNVFTVTGCGSALLVHEQEGVLAGCMSICKKVDTRGCYGINCCQTEIPFKLVNYGVKTTVSEARGGCLQAFLMSRYWNPPLHDTIANGSMSVPVVLFWKWNITDCYMPYRQTLDLGNNRCSCSKYLGLEGNPYLIGGCQVVEVCATCSGYCGLYQDEFTCYHNRKKATVVGLGVGIGAGVISLAVGVLWLYKVVQKRKNKKRKEQFFKRNGGLLLKQQVSSDEGLIEKTRLFNARELEKATGQFNDDRILGRGGHGTVYKGMLTDGRIVAVKKSKLVDESQVEQFINEVVILSQINHRNVVKLLGCCLETEVPILVYEYVSNGTLFEYIQDENNEYPTSWSIRLQIATEVAGALAYLHYATSIPIYHRDIKSTNILLDEKFRAKVSDFGTSRSISVDQTHLTTLVKGTFGYLDPEYFQSNQFTEKSDVYSFGVVLVELLTGKKAIFQIDTGERTSLATFILSIGEASLLDSIDDRILDGSKEQLIAVAGLAKKCLNLNGKSRPTMKQVAMELEGIRMTQMPLHDDWNLQGENCTKDRFNAKLPMEFDTSVGSSSDVHPLVFNTFDE